MSALEKFCLEDSGQGRWRVRHHQTHALVGSIIRSRRGFLLSDDSARMIGSYESIEGALRELYAAVRSERAQPVSAAS